VIPPQANPGKVGQTSASKLALGVADNIAILIENGERTFTGNVGGKDVRLALILYNDLFCGYTFNKSQSTVTGIVRCLS
jgi:hypothetical protein